MSCGAIGGLNLTLADTDKYCAAIMELPDSSNMGKAIDEACCFCHGSTYKTTYPSGEPSGFPTLSSVPTIEAIPSSQPSACFDEPDWYFNITHQLGCDALVNDPVDKCQRFSTVEYMYMEKVTYDACCICGGGIHHSTQPSDSPSTFPSDSPTNSPSSSSVPSDTPTSRTREPSSSPSLSQVPTDFPRMTEESIYNGFTCHYTSECKGTMECLGNVCKTVSYYFYVIF
jgi:hypothetical protein